MTNQPTESKCREEVKCEHKDGFYHASLGRYCVTCRESETQILEDQLTETKKRLEEALKPIRAITCAYCGFKVSLDDKDGPKQMTDHIFSCEKNPLVEMAKTACDIAEKAEARIAELEREKQSILDVLVDRDGDLQIGWRGESKDIDCYACEFCKASHLDFRLIPHTETCLVTKLKAIISC